MSKTLVSAISIMLVGSVFAMTMQYTGVAFGYGYGYGACTADRPNELSAEYVNNDKRIQLNWAAVEFSDCDDTAAASYRVQVRQTDATLVSEYSDLTTTSKKISASALKTNKPYKFRVKATASDDSATEWSLYKSFRTLPKKPSDLTITQTGAGSVRVGWENVVRSKKLRYYQVVVKKGNRVVYSKRVSLGLRRNKTGTTVQHLKAGVRYRVKVRAVARASSKGDYTKKYFRLD